MILWEDSRAPNPRRVRMFLAEKGIEVERRHIDIMSEEHKAPERLKQNPMARVPFLELDDGDVIAETIAICRYFDALQPDPCLFGETPKERGMAEMWQRRMELNLLTPVSEAFRHTHPKMAVLETPQIRAWGECNVPRAETALDFLNERLGDHPFIAGDRFTVADITAVCAIDFMRVARIALKDHHRHIRRWHGEIAERPSYAA